MGKGGRIGKSSTPSLMLEARLAGCIARALRESWTVERLASEAQCSYLPARNYVKRFLVALSGSAVDEIQGLSAGVWPHLRSVAADDLAMVKRIKNENPRSLKSEKRLTHAVHRLACIAAAAQGRSPDAGTPD
jgi:hypothetical protein